MRLKFPRPAQTRLIFRLVRWIFLALLGWLALVAVSIYSFGALDQARPADCIIVLGAGVNGADPSPVFAERIRHGIQLYKAGLAPRIIFTGGLGEGKTRSESSVAATIALSQGLPPEAILMEESSRTTQSNLSEAARLMRSRGLRSAILVSDPMHMKRAVLMAEDLGIEAFSSPTPSSAFRSWKTIGIFLIKEIYFCHQYKLAGF